MKNYLMFMKFFMVPMLILVPLTAFFMRMQSEDPEVLLLGTWKEESWQYEKINEEGMIGYDASEIKKHEAEMWEFQEDHTMFFKREGEVIDSAVWIIKGRGHILKLMHSDGSVELFDIKELSNQVLAINFDIGMEIRGIARLEFRRVMGPEMKLPNFPYSTYGFITPFAFCQ